MRYKVGDKFRFKGTDGLKSYNICTIVEIKPNSYVQEGPLAIWFIGTGPVKGRQWIGSNRFDNPKDDWYGVTTTSRKEFTDEEYEELLV